MMIYNGLKDRYVIYRYSEWRIYSIYKSRLCVDSFVVCGALSKERSSVANRAERNANNGARATARKK
mgnify:CR=1 FL=1